MKKINSLLFVCFGFLFFGGCENLPDEIKPNFDDSKLIGYWRSNSSDDAIFVVDDHTLKVCDPSTKQVTPYQALIDVRQDSTDAPLKVAINVFNPDGSGNVYGKLNYAPASSAVTNDSLNSDNTYTLYKNKNLIFFKFQDGSIPSCFQSSNPPSM